VKKIFILIITMLMLSGCGGEKVVIYSSMEENRNQALKEQLKEEFKDINVVVQSISTGNSAAKIKNEGKNIEADIILDLETSHMSNLKDNFADISSFDTSMYLNNIPNTNKYLIFSKQTSNLIIDKAYFEKHKLEIPTTYEDLLKEEYKNIIAMPDPKTSGTGYAFFLNVVNIMGEEKAIEYFEKLSKNIREYTASGSGPTNLLKQGEIAIAMGMTSQGVAAINEGYNFQIVQLKTGTVYNTTSFGIINGKETDENVVKVFNWLLTDFNKYDKENFMPDKILKEQKSNVKNYPTDLKEANMKDIENMERKTYLTELWSENNG